MVSDVHLVGNWQTGGAMLECHRDECMVDERYWWTQDLPYACTIEQAVEAEAAHLETHNAK